MKPTHNTVRSRTGVYHTCWGAPGEAGRADCNQNLRTKLAKPADVQKASPDAFCSKCFPSIKAAKNH